MKHLLKKFVLLSYFCLATFLYYSCTQEKEYINKKNRINFDLKEKSLKEALDMPIFSTAYSKLTKKKFSSSTSETARTALEDQFGFTIVPEVPVKIITKPDGTVFFTLLIEREVKEELKFENLMIQVKNTETSAAIFKYTMEEKAIKTITNEIIIKEIPNSQFTDLNIDGKIFFNGDGDTCFDINVILCDVPDNRPAGHVATSECWYYFNNVPGASNIYYATSVVCMNDGGIGGGGGGDTGGGGGGSSTNNTGGLGASGGSSDPVVISPTPCRTGNCIEAEVIKKPCLQLKKLADFDKMNLKPKIDILKNKVISNVQNEWGLKLTKIGPTTINAADSLFAYDAILVEGNLNDVPLSYGDDFIGGAHIHTNKGYAIHTWRDIYNLSLSYQDTSPNKRDDVANFLVVKDPLNLTHPKVYAIKVDNITTLQTKLDQDLNNPLYLDSNIDVTIKNLNESLLPLYKYSPCLEHGIIQHFSSYGISLYQAADDDLTEWNKLVVGPIGDILSPKGVRKIPCIFQ